MIPQNTVDISADPEMVQKVERLLERLEDNDDVRRSIITRCFRRGRRGMNKAKRG